MNKYLIKVLMSICIMGFMISGSVVGAEENATANATESVNVTATATVTPTQEPTAEPTEGKFRVGPTVTLRPVNDVVDKSQDGLVELYMYNPTVNDVTLNADVQISVPSGIHVYGESFASGGAAGTVAGTFTVPPGTTRTISINIKSEKTGTFTVHFTGLYWPGDDKDAFQQISLTHPLTVNEPSVNPNDPKPINEPNPDESNQVPVPSGFLAVIALAFVALVIRKSS
ncbi:MAG: hypothetical protein C5S40_02825 [ANME-2 cluster archaeon]|nr:hypothetical protein [ANME-2 cluster archaeon]